MRWMQWHGTWMRISKYVTLLLINMMLRFLVTNRAVSSVRHIAIGEGGLELDSGVVVANSSPPLRYFFKAVLP